MGQMISDAGVDVRNVVTAFAQYGFRKTSMEDIARATNLSRQSIYKKFGSKEACYHWALRAYMTGLYEQVFELLAQDSQSPLDTLQAAVDTMVGEGVEFSQIAHGAELLDAAMKAVEAVPGNLLEEYNERMAAFLLRYDMASSMAQGRELAHVVITASRGALLNAVTRQAFSDDMGRVLRTLFPRSRQVGH
ncbi:MAG: TetR/AcrR family transcriptional regulator [Marinibacterium sp.]|nr:TetR/AcrR family transcriptional regulator [Marinibacterium sp.]